MEAELINNVEGLEGELGYKGERGYSAYEIAVKNGFEGTEQDWLDHFGVDLTGYIKTSDVKDNLTSTDTAYPLSAKQGKILNDGKINVADIVDDCDTDDATKVLSAKQGKRLMDWCTSLYRSKANVEDIYDKDECDDIFQTKVLSGTANPTSSLGNDGDVYFQYEE